MRKLKIKHLKVLILHTVKFSLKLTACMTSGRSNNLGGPMVIKCKFEVNSRKNIFQLSYPKIDRPTPPPPPQCVQMDFTWTFQTNTKCSNIYRVWSHFYKMFVSMAHRRLWYFKTTKILQKWLQTWFILLRLVLASNVGVKSIWTHSEESLKEIIHFSVVTS